MSGGGEGGDPVDGGGVGVGVAADGVAIDEARAVALLEGAVRIPSVSGDEAAVATYFVEEMRARGFTAEVDGAGNAVGRIGTGPTTVLMLGHIDTVPGEIAVRREGDELFGRGSVDATGPFCAFIEAAAAVGARRGDELSLVVVGAVEEEVASSKGAHYAFPRENPDYVIVGEPSGWDALTLGYKGRLSLHYQVEQAMAHGAGRDPSAADRGLAFWRAVEDWAAGFNEGKSVFQALDRKVVSAHTGDDSLRDRFELVADLRIPLGFPVAEFTAVCEAAAAEGAAGDGERGAVEAEARVTVRGEVEAVRAPKSGPLVRAFLRAIRAQGGKPRFKVKTGTSDMNLMPKYHPGVPCVTYGPGDSAYDHAPDERISVAEYLRGVGVLVGVLGGI